jgi:hypothetical protein
MTTHHKVASCAAWQAPESCTRFRTYMPAKRQSKLDDNGLSEGRAAIALFLTVVLLHRKTHSTSFAPVATPLSCAGDATVVFRLLWGPERGRCHRTPSARASLPGLPVVPFKLRMLTCGAARCKLLCTW